jgi:hypothetical protein
MFNTRIDTTQNFVCAIQDKNMSLRQFLNDFAQLNKSEFNKWNLAVQLKQVGEYQLLVVSGIPTLNESMSYFRKVILNRNLFNLLGQATYRNFLITNENLQKLIEQNKVDEYREFFRSNYIQRAPAQTGSTSTPAAATTATAQQNTIAEPPKPKEYTGPYNQNVEGKQYFVFVIPKLDIDQPAFISGIEQFNLASYANLKLKVEVLPLDEIRQIVRVSGIPDKETASLYFTKVVNNRELYIPLRQGNYRNFLITEANFEVFLKEKNILDYTNFYKRFYLGQ